MDEFNRVLIERDFLHLKNTALQQITATTHTLIIRIKHKSTILNHLQNNDN